MASDEVRIAGFVAPGFESVRDAFAANFAGGEEVGAAFAAVQNRELVVDLWGGLADRSSGRPWSRDTLQLIFSGTKGLVAGVMLMLLDRGMIRLDQPVSRYWPEFGKPEILIRHIVSHQARLPGIEAPITVEDITDDRLMAEVLAKQLPSTDPRAAACYHPLTFGWLCGEVVRRVSGKSVGKFFSDEIAVPLGLEVWIGLPEEHEGRVTQFEFAPGWGTSSYMDPAIWARDPFIQSIWSNPDHFTPDNFPWNKRPWHAAEIPAVNAICTARSVAAYYGWLAGGSAISEETISLAYTPISDWMDEILGSRRRHGICFELQTDLPILGPPRTAFGHNGAGGSNHGAWPNERIGYSYCMNLLRDGNSDDQRSQRILTALYQSVKAGAPSN